MIKTGLEELLDIVRSSAYIIKDTIKENNYLLNDLTIGQTKDLISFTDQTFGSIAYYDWSYGDKFLTPNSDVNEFTNSK